MKPASIEIGAPGPAPQTFATVSTTSGLQALHHAIGTEQRRTTFQIVPMAQTPGGHARYELQADSPNLGAAIDTVRSLLDSFTSAAARGLLRDFEFTRSVDMLHRIPGNLVYALPPHLPQGELALSHLSGAEA